MNNSLEIYARPHQKEELRKYAKSKGKSMSVVLWESFYKLIGKPPQNYDK